MNIFLRRKFERFEKNELCKEGNVSQRIDRDGIPRIRTDGGLSDEK